jgi:ABC-2 type transport system ATP-binding protein
VCDARAEARGLRVLGVDVDGIVVAADRGEQEHLGLADRLRERRAVADGERLERFLVVGHGTNVRSGRRGPRLGRATNVDLVASTDRMEPAISVRSLVKRFGDVVAVNGISFDVARGTIFGLLGRNGAGKTTTLETCIGLAAPTSGSVRVLGLDPAARRDFEALRPRIGVQLQATSLPEKAHAGEVLELYAAYYGVEARTTELAARVGLEDKLSRPVGKMSGGEQQRLALALALLHDPEVLFLDEPTAGMDAFGRRILWAEVERLKTIGKTLVLTTHYIEEAERLCDEICIVQHGRVVAQDTPAALVARYGGDACVDFTAKGFRLDPTLDRLGRWTHAGDAWSLAVQAEPGHALGAIVAHANALGVAIDELDLHRPDLEDAFVAITGEALDDEPASAAA